MRLVAGRAPPDPLGELTDPLVGFKEMRGRGKRKEGNGEEEARWWREGEEWEGKKEKGMGREEW